MKSQLISRFAKIAAVSAAAALTLTACEEGIVEGADNFYFTVANGALDGTQHSLVAEEYYDAVEEATDGRIEFERTSFEAVCGMAEVADCVRNGRADIGLTITDYTPHLLPTMSVMSISFLNNDIQAAVEGLYDVHTNYEPARAQLEQSNLEYIGAWPVGVLLIGAKEPIDEYEDLRGLSARAAGPVTQDHPVGHRLDRVVRWLASDAARRARAIVAAGDPRRSALHLDADADAERWSSWYNSEEMNPTHE